MGKISNFLNSRKFDRLKQKYISKYNKTGILGSIEEIQEFISKKDIKVISSGKKYGDKLDIVEDIFNGNKEITKAIEINRKDELTGLVKSIPGIFDDCNYQGIFIFDSDKFKKIKSQIFNFENYYLDKTKEKPKFDIKSKYQTNIEDINKITNIVKNLYKDSDNINITEFNETMCKIVENYGIKVLNETEGYQQKEEILLNVQNVLDNIYNNEIEGENLEKKNFIELARKYPSESTNKYFEKLDMLDVFEKYGLDIDINDEKIGYIDASSEEKNEQFYQLLDQKKKGIRPEDIGVKDFAMVRTTEYFPKDHEMEIIDELNARIKSSNFLGDKIVNKELQEKYGKDWNNKAYFMGDTQESREIKEEKERLEQKYYTTSPMYRSTKHFTLNGLVSSHEYGDFSNNPYIIIDPLEEHIDDPDLLSINEADTYFEKSREKPMKLSKNAEIMMPIEEYAKAIKDPKLKKQIHSYSRVTLFSRR